MSGTKIIPYSCRLVHSEFRSLSIISPALQQSLVTLPQQFSTKIQQQTNPEHLMMSQSPKIRDSKCRQPITFRSLTTPSKPHPSESYLRTLNTRPSSSNSNNSTALTIHRTLSIFLNSLVRIIQLLMLDPKLYLKLSDPRRPSKTLQMKKGKAKRTKWLRDSRSYARRLRLPGMLTFLVD